MVNLIFSHFINCFTQRDFILSEHRHPSIDALHYLIKSISELSEAETNHQRLDDLYEEGHSLITKRLLKNF